LSFATDGQAGSGETQESIKHYGNGKKNTQLGFVLNSANIAKSLTGNVCEGFCFSFLF
jgi:hypothetical protein